MTATRLLPLFDTGSPIAYYGSITELHAATGEVLGPCPCRTCGPDTERLHIVLDSGAVLEHARAQSLVHRHCQLPSAARAAADRAHTQGRDCSCQCDQCPSHLARSPR